MRLVLASCPEGREAEGLLYRPRGEDAIHAWHSMRTADIRAHLAPQPLVTNLWTLQGGAGRKGAREGEIGRKGEIWERCWDCRYPVPMLAPCEMRLRR